MAGPALPRKHTQCCERWPRAVRVSQAGCAGSAQPQEARLCLTPRSAEGFGAASADDRDCQARFAFARPQPLGTQGRLFLQQTTECGWHTRLPWNAKNKEKGKNLHLDPRVVVMWEGASLPVVLGSPLWVQTLIWVVAAASRWGVALLGPLSSYDYHHHPRRARPWCGCWSRWPVGRAVRGFGGAPRPAVGPWDRWRSWGTSSNACAMGTPACGDRRV